MSPPLRIFIRSERSPLYGQDATGANVVVVGITDADGSPAIVVRSSVDVVAASVFIVSGSVVVAKSTVVVFVGAAVAVCRTVALVGSLDNM